MDNKLLIRCFKNTVSLILHMTIESVGSGIRFGYQKHDVIVCNLRGIDLLHMSVLDCMQINSLYGEQSGGTH